MEGWAILSQDHDSSDGVMILLAVITHSPSCGASEGGGDGRGVAARGGEGIIVNNCL